MRTSVRTILCIVLICTTSLAADGWAVTPPKFASRQVLLTLFIGSQQIQKWKLPVAYDAPAVKDGIQSRWITIPKDLAKNYPRRIFTDTWLGSIDANEVWVRFMWWPNKKRDGTERLQNSFIVTRYNAKHAYSIGEDMHFEVSYEVNPH